MFEVSFVDVFYFLFFIYLFYLFIYFFFFFFFFFSQNVDFAIFYMIFVHIRVILSLPCITFV